MSSEPSGGAPSYASTTSTSPYATGKASNSGSSYELNDFLTNTNKAVESSMPGLYNQLLNPSLDNATTKARSDLFYKTFNEDAKKSFENNLINPLSSRNMMRSSVATDLGNKFQKDSTDAISTFNNSLIANNTADTSNLISTLMNLYLTGANLGQQSISNARGDAQQVNAFNQANYAQESANNNAMWSNISSLGGQAMSAGGSVGSAALLACDERLKENIVKIGEKNGYNWYEFTYKDGYGLPEGRQEGVIAQEVEKVNPDAVVMINGFRHVDYAKL